MEKILNLYYENNAIRLHNMVDNVLFRLRFQEVDREDFYSLANEIFVNAMQEYDNSRTFDVFLYACLNKRFKTEMTRRNRYKRRNIMKVEMRDEYGKLIRDRYGRIVMQEQFLPDISIYTPVNGEIILGDMIAANIDIEKEFLAEQEDMTDENVERYLKSLSKIQRKIIEMKMQNIEVQHIKKALGITDKQYAAYMKDAVQYEHIRLLHI